MLVYSEVLNPWTPDQYFEHLLLENCNATICDINMKASSDMLIINTTGNKTMTPAPIQLSMPGVKSST